MISSAPTQSAFSNLHVPDAGNKDLSIIALPQTFNRSLEPAVVAQRVNSSDYRLATHLSTEVEYTTVTWPITDILSLTINIGPWDLAPEKILHTLEAASNAVGKKRAEALLDGKFKLETGSRVNTMIFEISPGYIYKRLTWADVGEVLGENGLPKFFRETEEWHCAYFYVIDSARGNLGYGAVRKWYMLESVGGGVGARLGSV